MATAKKSERKVVRKPRQAAQDDAPRYLVLAQSYIDNRLLEAGSEVVYYGVPGKALRPLNAAAVANKKAAVEVRDDDHDDSDARAAAMRELDNDLQGVQPKDEKDDFGDFDSIDVPLPDAERRELEKQAQASVEAEQKKQGDDTNRTTIKLQGDPRHPHNENPSALQGSTPVTDGKSKK